MSVDHSENVRPCAVDLGVDENLLWRLEPACVLLHQTSVEIDLDDLILGGEAHAELARPARTNEHAIRSRQSRTRMPGRGLGQLQLTHDATRLRDAFA